MFAYDVFAQRRLHKAKWKSCGLEQTHCFYADEYNWVCLREVKQSSLFVQQSLVANAHRPLRFPCLKMLTTCAFVICVGLAWVRYCSESIACSSLTILSLYTTPRITPPSLIATKLLSPSPVSHYHPTETKHTSQML